jgi:uracil-DNA glycosylase
MKLKHKVLIKDVRACTLCTPYLPLGPDDLYTVQPKCTHSYSGPSARKKVYETGVSFDDLSGKRLREWMGIDKKTFYNEKKIAIFPMGFCYPGTGKSGDFPPRPECAPLWRERLLESLPNIKLVLVIGH